MTTPASISTPSTRKRRRSTTWTMSRSMMRISIPRSFSSVVYRFLRSFTSSFLIGRSVLRGQFGLRHRRPVQAWARPKRTVCSSPPRHPPHPQSVRHPKRNPSRSLCPGRSAQRDRHHHRTHVREPPDLVARRVCCDAGKAMAEPVLATRGRVDDRAVWRPSA